MVIPTHEPNKNGLFRTEYGPEICKINKNECLERRG